MYNLLATKRGRLATFFLLYVSEGIPFGFTSVAIAAYMRRGHLEAGEVARFIAMLYLPWAFKFVLGPVVDVFYSEKFGRRRLWILGCQGMMVTTILTAMWVDFVEQFSLFVAVIVVHNVFAATQDIAIDALAVSTLDETERGAANGFMFAGQYLGIGIGGSGVMYLLNYGIEFQEAFVLVAGAIGAVMLLVTLPLKEPRSAELPSPTRRSLSNALLITRNYAVTAVRAMFGSRPAFAGFLFALLPAGAHSMSLAVRANLTVDLGFDDAEIGNLTLLMTVVSGCGCIVGGWLSDWLGRRRMLALYILLITIPPVVLALIMYRLGYLQWAVVGWVAAPVSRRATMVTALWVASGIYAFVFGLMYGSRTALYMDICHPAVAATQFTAYMALLNLTTSWTTFLYGELIENFGYPVTLLVDAALGLVCLAILPWTLKPKAQVPRSAGVIQ